MAHGNQGKRVRCWTAFMLKWYTRMRGTFIRALIAGAVWASLAYPTFGADDLLKIGQQEPSTLDMMNQTDSASARVGYLLFDRLLTRGFTEQIIPELAAAAPRLINPLTWRLTLRQGVKFHNGEAFDAKSVEFSLNRLIGSNGKLRGAATFAPIERVTVLDPFTVEIVTRRPWPVLPAALTLPQAVMYPPVAYKNADSATITQKPIGTGAYRFVSWVRGVELRLQANPDSWRGKSRFTGVSFIPAPDRVAVLLKGALDLAVPIPPEMTEPIEQDPKLSIRTTPSARTVQIMFYTQQGPLSDRRVRQAIALAIDPDDLIKRELGGRATRLATMLTSLHFGVDLQQRPIGPDLARAAKLLVEAGYPNGIELGLTTPSYLSRIAGALVAQLEKSKIKVGVKALETSAYIEALARRAAGPMVLMQWNSPLLDAEEVYDPLFRSGGRYSTWTDARFDALVDQAAGTMDPARRAALYREATRRWLEQVPAVPLYQEWWVYGLRKDLRISLRVNGDVGVTKCDCPNDKTCCPLSDDCADWRTKNTCP